MKNKTNSSIARLSIFFILFVLSGLSILSFSIPDCAFITKNETDGKWLPEGSRWLLSAREAPADSVWQNSSEKINEEKIEKIDATVYLCGIIPFKKVDISVTDEMKVIPGGDIIGINLKTKGVLVAGTEDITDDGKTYSPAKKAGLKSGDIITSINKNSVNTTEDIQNAIENSGEVLTIEGERKGEKCTWTIELPKEEKKIGLWVRDTVAGIGTVTFYNEGQFAALGHPISDIDTGEYVISEGGSIFPASVAGVDKSEKGVPGALKGVFSGKKLGDINNNSSCGIFGTSSNPDYKEVSVSPRKEVKTGDAKIICDIGDGREEFDAKIIRILPSGDTSKGMVIEITDEELIGKCGGIVQGMSGSPILQDEKLVGAVTHVFVNDPTKGYGIFIENMLFEAEKIK